MPDIALRFHKDMLVVSAPLDGVLARQGIDAARDSEYLALVEPEVLREALRLEALAGAKCLVTPTYGSTPARLAHQHLDERLADVAHEALAVVQALTPQHVFFEVGPCGLPLDASSAASLNENRAQYAAVARMVAQETCDALFLNGFASTADLKCALMGVRQVFEGPVFASVCLDAKGCVVREHFSLEEAMSLMAEYGADVAGFSTAAAPEEAARLVSRAVKASMLPLLVQLQVESYAPKQGGPTPNNPYYCPDTMVHAAALLRRAGAQFLRAAGKATPSYTGALVAACDGFDVQRPVEAE